MPGGDDAARARQLEIFLDAVAMYSSDDYSWLLDQRFEFLLGEGSSSWQTRSGRLRQT